MAVPSSSINDPTFGQEMLGKGMAIEPSEGKLYSPIDGSVAVVIDTKHALSIVSDNGAEILMHVGLDTVKLKGEGFKAFVKQGDEIKIGQKLIEFDIDLLKSKGYCLDVPIVITNMMNYTEVVCTKETNINIGENLLSIK